MSTLMEQISQCQSQSAADAAAQYRQLVEDTHHGTPRDPAECVDILRRAGKSVGDLESEVKRLTKIDGLLKQLPEMSQQAGKKYAVTKAIATENAAYEKLTQEHRQRGEELERQLALANNADTKLANMIADLQALGVTVPPTEIELQRQIVTSAYAAWDRAQQAAKDYEYRVLSEARSQFESCKFHLEHATWDRERAERQLALDDATKALDQCRAERDRLNAHATEAKGRHDTGRAKLHQMRDSLSDE